jgi:hypothetical protein
LLPLQADAALAEEGPGLIVGMDLRCSTGASPFFGCGQRVGIAISPHDELCSV